MAGTGAGERPGVALVGFGRMGQIHLETLRANQHLLRLAYVVDDLVGPVLEAKVRWRLAETEVLASKDLHRVLEDESVAGVVLATPTNTHAALVRACLQAGKDVMCEKPVGMDLREVQECYEAAAKAGRTLMCALNRRFDPVYAEMRERLRSGSLGRLQFAQAFVRDHPAPAPDVLANLGSLVVDMGPHGIDTLMWMVGERPGQVVAFGHGAEAATRAREDFDAFGLMLKFPSGLIAYVDSCRNAPYGYDQRLELVGDRAAVVAETAEESPLVERGPEGQTHRPLLFSFPQRFRDAYRLELLHFADVLRGAPCLVSPASVLASTVAVHAAQESITNNSIVHIQYPD